MQIYAEKNLNFVCTNVYKSITMCLNAYNGFMATPEVSHGMSGYTLWGRIALWSHKSVTKPYVYPHGFTDTKDIWCEVLMRLPTEWATHVSCETSEGGQKYILQKSVR